MVWKLEGDMIAGPVQTAGLPDFSWYNIPKREKIYQITIRYSKMDKNIPEGHKIYQIAVK
jgi:protoporphyrinogen oxidase